MRLIILLSLLSMSASAKDELPSCLINMYKIFSTSYYHLNKLESFNDYYNGAKYWDIEHQMESSTFYEVENEKFRNAKYARALSSIYTKSKAFEVNFPIIKIGGSCKDKVLSINYVNKVHPERNYMHVTFSKDLAIRSRFVTDSDESYKYYITQISNWEKLL